MTEDQDKSITSLAVGRPRSRDAGGQVILNRIAARLFKAESIPVTIDRFEVIDSIGVGGMGVVYRAHDPKLGRHVALKVLRSEMLGNELERSRLRREAQALAQLSHPNVVQVHEVGEAEGQAFIAMELVQGRPLYSWAQQEPRPSWQECVRVYLQAGEGLAAAHAEGLVHRDFKPANAIIDRKGQVRVLDFGLARQTRDTTREESGDALTEPAPKNTTWEASLTRTGTMLGTPAYMPLEQFEGRPADARSDQFSFCVALYEALHGVRPFEGRTLAELVASLAAGPMQPDSKNTKVPVKLQKLLERGLATTPEDRWPSMEALLVELRQLMTPRTTQWWAVSAAVVGLGLLAGGLGSTRLVAQREKERQERCSGASAQMGGVWNDARRQDVKAAILGTKLVYAPGTWERVKAGLDDYAAEWVGKHTEVCEATTVKGEQTGEEMELRMRCLRGRKTILNAQVKVLAEADAQVVEKAVEMVAGLPTLTRCDDLDWLQEQHQRLPLPENPEVVYEVDALRGRLADIKAQEDAGKYADALERVEPVVERAKTLGYMPLLAEVMLRRGGLRENNGQYVKAEKDLVRAHTLAVEHGHDDVVLEAVRSLTLVVGSRQARHAEGLVWGQTALPLAKRSRDATKLASCVNNVGSVLYSQGKYEESEYQHRRALEIRERALGIGHPHVASSMGNLGLALESQGNYEEAETLHRRGLQIRERALGPSHPNVADSMNNLGNVLQSQGQYEEAEAQHRQALHIRERALGAGHPDMADSMNNLGNVLTSQGKYEEAETQHRRALQIRERALGANHPYVAASRDNLGQVLQTQGRYEEAEIQHRRALQIREQALGADHSDVAASANNLGIVLASQGKYEEAETQYWRALQIWERALGAYHPNVAASVNNLGNVLTNQGKYEEAETQYRQVLQILKRTLGVDHPDVASSMNNLGNVLTSQGKYGEAETQYRRALQVWEQALGPGHPDVAYSVEGLAEVALVQSQFKIAREHAERAVSIHKTGKTAPEDLAYARFLLARALWPDRTQRHHARELAQLAQLTFANNSPRQEENVQAWLATHVTSR